MTYESITVGGLKVVEGGDCVAVSSSSGADYLRAGICVPLAQQKINATFLTHLTGGGGLNSAAVICTDMAGAASYSLAKASCSSTKTWPGCTRDTGIASSLYAYSRRPEIVGNFLRALARAKIMIYAVASSRSSISAVMSLKARDKAIRQLFEDFQFSSYTSPAEFFATQPPPEELVKKVIAHYQESVIKIYCLEELPDQDLWSLSVPSVIALESFGEALSALRTLSAPYHFSWRFPCWGKKSCCFPSAPPVTMPMSCVAC